MIGADWQERLRIEREEVRDRLMKLSAFIEASPDFQRLERIDQELLRKQRDVMVEYENIMDRRVRRLSLMPYKPGGST